MSKKEKLLEKFKDLLHSVESKPFKEKKLTALFPLVGDEYKSDLMIVGRALNRWGSKKDKIWWDSRTKISSKIIQNIIEYSGKDKGDCPLKWITDNWDKQSNGKYRMNRSQFWKVTQKILIELKITKHETLNWSSFLVWSNLYKIAPARGRNPSEKLCDAQYIECMSFLKAEINHFKPKRILFLTGYDWFKDFRQIGFSRSKRKYSLLEWEGYYNNIYIVVAKHPERKNETKYVRQVINSYNRLQRKHRF